jgi:DNA polymerase-3 subunit epsilon
MRDDESLYLGPFRSRRAAEVVVHAIWDAVPIRRCNGRGGRRTAACSFSQLGVAVCPCDGSVPEREYADVVERVRRGVISDPREILAPLQARMLDLASDQRFEEAADLRDRYTSLASALERRRAWQSLQAAGTIWAEDRDGNGALIERGHLIGAWNSGGSPPLVPEPSTAEVAAVPRSVADAEEARLIWKWLDRDGVEIIDSSGALALPARPIPDLAAAF